jgi:two-component system sensor histidine kinase DegS
VEERSDERARVAADLHDDVLQAITRVQQIAATIRTRRSAELVYEDIRDLHEAADYSLTAIREVMRNLKVSPLGTKGLLQTLRVFAQEVQLQSRVRIEMQLPSHVEASPQAQLVTFQVVREAIRNAVKHAAASRITVAIEQTNDAVKLRVTDDGAGFDPGAIDSDIHFGLQLTNERLELIGGVMDLESRPGEGTVISATVPLDSSQRGTDSRARGGKARHGSH